MVAPKLIPLLTRATIGGFVAAAIAGAAWGARSLTASGALAALCIGTVAVAAGWGWGLLLILYFVLSTALSRFNRAEKAARTDGIIEKGGARDAAQVFANGGIFLLMAIAFLVAPSPLWQWGALGALTASASDTWATEIGTLYGGEPRLLTRRTYVRSGTSGGITKAGTLGALLGAAVIALLGRFLGWPAAAAITALLAGVLGMFTDSYLGATLQERRWCDHCQAPTERLTHDCGHPTRHIGGLPWLRNDAVNVAATLVGALIGMLGAVPVLLQTA
jgi:uncharacterized protein (TIGR00297 family)